MKKLFSFFISIIIIVVLCDIIFGLLTKNYVKNYSLPGDYKSIDYVIKEVEDDVLILGSSVALGSIKPSIIEDSLHVTCYNAGANGQNLIFYKTLLDCILKRYTPKYIILTLTPDNFSNPGLGDRYNFLVPYYQQGFRTVDSCFNSKSAIEPYFLKSSFYRYNTIWLRILLYHFITPDIKGYKGFETKSKPLFPVELETYNSISRTSRDNVLIIKDIIQKCESNNIKLIINFPPQYRVYTKKTSGTIELIKELYKTHDFLVFNNFQDSLFLQHPEWFHDNVHFVEEGADVYTRLLVKQIKESLVNCK